MEQNNTEFRKIFELFQDYIIVRPINERANYPTPGLNGCYAHFNEAQ